MGGNGRAALERVAAVAITTPNLHTYVAEDDFAGTLSRAIEEAGLRARRGRASPSGPPTKDYYDFVYVLLNNRASGPERAAQRLLSGEVANELPASAGRRSGDVIVAT